MKRKGMIFGSILVLLGGALTLTLWGGDKHTANEGSSNQPVYTQDGKLALPANYREWVFVTSGFGMNYSNGGGSNPMFTNVFVTPEAYRSFMQTGKWPDKSMFVVEVYAPASHGSINKSGYYQDAFRALDVEVKDASRRSEWSYYGFAAGEKTGEPEGAGCNKCHNENGAVEHTFVQFYPILREIAIAKGVVKPGTGLTPKP